MKFSKRLDWDLEENDLARAVARKREASAPVLDLTSSNPTRSGLLYPESEILSGLSHPGALVYEPNPLGQRETREAIASYYASRGGGVEAEWLCLTSSTSEAYGYLFKLLCDPGDEVLVPSPSYPLFGYLAALDGVAARPYPLLLEDDWRIDFGALRSLASPRTRAILAVHPNNPTGSYVHLEDQAGLAACARERDIALIVDEVFLDFPLEAQAGRPSFGASASRDGGGLVFLLNGLSKLAGLPQMKLAWIAVRGESARRAEARTRLEHIADNYLSVSTPIQLAAPRLLELAGDVRENISERTRANSRRLDQLVAREPSVTALPAEAGWSRILRLPAIESSERWALRLLEEASVYVHPGALFGFTTEACLVLSLLTEPEAFEAGVRAILRSVGRRLEV